jgi:hypothetical protein
MSACGTDAEAQAEAQAHAYAYKPSLFRAAFEFRLTPSALEFTMGPRSGRISYGDIRRLRLSYRPTSVQSSRYLTEIWPAAGPKLSIASTSRRTMIDAERHDAAYAAFVRDLAGRVAKANPDAPIELGTLPLVYWPGLTVFVVLAIAMLVLAVRAVQVEQWGGTAVIVGFWALFLWQIGRFFWRNRPRHCLGEAVPDDILPPAAVIRSQSRARAAQ